MGRVLLSLFEHCPKFPAVENQRERTTRQEFQLKQEAMTATGSLQRKRYSERRVEAGAAETAVYGWAGVAGGCG